jgi:hypothetical protein
MSISFNDAYKKATGYTIEENIIASYYPRLDYLHTGGHVV